VAARLDVSVSDPMPQTTELPDVVPNEAAAQTGVFTVEHQATASHGFMLPPDPAARPKASPLHFLLSDPQYGRILDRLELHLGQACTLADVVGRATTRRGPHHERPRRAVGRGGGGAATWSRTQEGGTP
jgi:hypothetical protein